MKKSALLIIFAMIMLSTKVWGASQTFVINEENIQFDAPRCSLSVEGLIEESKNNSIVFMEIYPKGYTENVENVVAAANTLTVGEKFKFLEILLPDNMAEGTYSIILTSMYNTQSIEITDAFYYGGSENARQVIKSIDEAESVSEINSLINAKHNVLGFEQYDKYKKITSYKTALTDILNESFPDSEENLTENWEKLLLLLEKGTLSAFILDTKSSEDIKDIVENYSEILGLDLKNTDGSFNAYERASDKTKSILYDMMLSAEYTLPSELPAVFKSMSAAAYIRNERYTDIIKVFNSVSDIKNTDYTYYNLLSPTEQDSLLKKTAEKAKKSLDIKEIISYFETESRKKANASDNPEGGGNSVSSGNNSGSSLNGYTPAVKNEAVHIEAIRFDDIENTKWAEQAIMTLAKKGIINGVENNKFAPDDYVTRAQLCKIAALAFDLKLYDNSSDFSDVDKSLWYSEYIDILSSNQIVKGYENGEFRPEGYVTRQELSVIIDRILKLKEIKKEKIREFKEFSDDSYISDFARESIVNLYEYGILNGDGYNVMPLENATRAQTVQLIYLLMEN